jgi:hypothetical protein
MICLLKTAGTLEYAIMGVSDTSSDRNIRVYTTTTKIRMAAISTPTVVYSASSTDHAKGTWFVAAGVTSASTSRIAYSDGIAGTEDTTDVVPSSIDTTYIGAYYKSSITGFLAGTIAACAFYSIALTARQVEQLSRQMIGI